jgi:hypothetical protein
MKDQNSTIIKKNIKRLSKMMTNFVNEKNETLEILINELESTTDPNPSELYLLDSLYQLREKILLTESRINNYIINERKESLLGNKIQDLYNSSRKSGTSILFND